MQTTEALPAPPRASTLRSVARLALGLALLSSGCAGSCPAATTSAASVTPSPCGPAGSAAAGPAMDPLALVGGEGIVFGRVDLASIRQSRFGDAATRVLELLVRSEVRGQRADGLLEAIARTEVFAFALGDNGFVMVAQGRYTHADLAVFELEERDSRREHVIHRRHRNALALAHGRYAVVAERFGVEAALDRIDGLEDPAPQDPLLRHVADSIGAYRSYFSLIGLPREELRREFAREEGLQEVQADVRWAALSVAQGGAGIEVLGRVHTITEAAAAVILDMSLALQREAADELARELPTLGATARALTLAREGTDATLTYRPSESETRQVIDEVTRALERDVARRASYEDSSASVGSTTVP